MAGPRRVVICDDSRAYAAALKRFLEHDPEIEVPASFQSAEQMLPNLKRLDPDLITMDLAMPGMGGVRAIEEIMADDPRPILVLSAHAGKGSERAAEALAAGALEAMPKTGLRLDEPDNVWATALRGRVKRLASVQLKRRVRVERARPRKRLPRLPAANRPRSVVAIGTSTGFPLPVLVVQHIAPGFAEGLVGWLDRKVPLPVRFAKARAPARPGVWFAPDDAHLMLDRSLCFVVDSVTERGPHRPSVDVLFESVASAAGTGVVGVVMTGMGRDGSDGVRAICAADGLVIAQDEASSAVFGMPKSAIDAGAGVVLPLGEIGAALRTLAAAGKSP